MPLLVKTVQFYSLSSNYDKPLSIIKSPFNLLFDTPFSIKSGRTTGGKRSIHAKLGDSTSLSTSHVNKFTKRLHKKQKNLFDTQYTHIFCGIALKPHFQFSLCLKIVISLKLYADLSLGSF